jgi:transcriptional regulator with XRE-family HTH domain
MRCAWMHYPSMHSATVEGANRVGDLIRRKRSKRYSRQIAFATALGVSQSTVSRWESGAAYPDYASACLLQKHLGGRTSDYLA